MQTNFFLSRHGETQWNKIKKLQGQLDSPLTDIGVIQANNIARYFKGQSVDLIVSSPLKRALNTAEICQQQIKCPIIKQPDLMERHFGDWQGQCVVDIEHDENYQKIFYQVTEHTPPNGESASACALRFQRALVAIAKDNLQRNVLIVSHGDIMRCFLSNSGLGHIDGLSNQYDNGCLIAICFDYKKMEFTANSQFIESVQDYA